MSTNYDVENIQTLDGTEAIQLRPGMTGSIEKHNSNYIPLKILEDYKEYFDKQINPLANAGQRFGISANGISYKSFCINDIFNNVYDSNKYIFNDYDKLLF